MSTTDPAHFQAIPWTAPLLSDTDYRVVPSRFGKPMRDKRGEFFTTTLATTLTITACVYQIRKTPVDPYAQRAQTAVRVLVPEVRAFIDTSSGLNGYPNVAHGGFVSAIIDEVMGFLISSNNAATESSQDTSAKPPPQDSVPMSTTMRGTAVMTVELTIKYRKPVPTGEAIMIRTWFERIDGRKIFVRATVEAEERVVLAEGFGVFVALRPGVKGPPPREKTAKI